MSRISLVEAYDNRDVIGQLVRLREDVNELQNILKDIDPDGDLTNVVTKTGDQTIDGIKTFIGKIVADCDIIQNGAAYETHAEQVYSVNDYIVTRDGQITGLGPGELSGFHVKKYNGVDDSRLGVDSSGTMRVGDVGSEQPLMTRDEVADMTSGNILSWDGVNKKAITSGTSVTAITGDISTLQTTVAGKVSGTGDIGSDTQPVKVVNGQAVAVTDKLVKHGNNTQNISVLGTSVSCIWNDSIVILLARDFEITQTGRQTITLPVKIYGTYLSNIFSGGTFHGYIYTLTEDTVQVNFESTGMYNSFELVMLRKVE